MSLEITTGKKINIKIDGEPYSVMLPSAKDQIEYGKKLKKVKNDLDYLPLMVDFLSERGLPKEKVELFDFEGIEQLTKLLMPDKKK